MDGSNGKPGEGEGAAARTLSASSVRARVIRTLVMTALAAGPLAGGCASSRTAENRDAARAAEEDTGTTGEQAVEAGEADPGSDAAGPEQAADAVGATGGDAAGDGSQLEPSPRSVADLAAQPAYGVPQPLPDAEPADAGAPESTDAEPAAEDAAVRPREPRSVPVYGVPQPPPRPNRPPNLQNQVELGGELYAAPFAD
jgi:hypothetical protein